MSAVGYDLSTTAVLWRRDLLLFFGQRSRMIGALLTTLLLWLALGAGIAPSFAVEGSDVGYLEYLYPGVVLMLMLQISISATMSVIEDRNQGFLQGVLVAPGSRAALVLGKTAGSATVALIHAWLFLLLAPLAGFGYARIAWIPLLAATVLTAVALTAVGFALAWTLDSVQGYHVVMSLVLFPLWILSGAMFPPTRLHPLLAVLVRWNPMSYAMSALRRALYGSASAGAGVGMTETSPGLEWLVLVAATLLAVGGAVAVAARRSAPV